MLSAASLGSCRFSPWSTAPLLLQAVTCLAFADGGTVLVSGAEDTLVCVWLLSEVLRLPSSPHADLTAAHTWHAPWPSCFSGQACKRACDMRLLAPSTGPLITATCPACSGVLLTVN